MSAKYACMVLRVYFQQTGCPKTHSSSCGKFQNTESITNAERTKTTPTVSRDFLVAPGVWPALVPSPPVIPGWFSSLTQLYTDVHVRGFVHTPRAHTCTFRSVWLARPSDPWAFSYRLLNVYANGPYSLHPRFKNHYNCTLKLISMNEAQILCDKICL